MYCSCYPIYQVLPDLEFQLVFCSHDLSLSGKELIEGVSWLSLRSIYISESLSVTLAVSLYFKCCHDQFLHTVPVTVETEASYVARIWE